MTLGIPADDPDQGDLPTEGSGIARNIARRAKHDDFAGPGEDRDRGLRGNPCDIAIDKAIHHKIAHAGDAGSGYGGQEMLEWCKVHGSVYDGVNRLQTRKQIAGAGQGQAAGAIAQGLVRIGVEFEEDALRPGSDGATGDDGHPVTTPAS